MKCELKSAGAEVSSRSGTIPNHGETGPSGENTVETQGTATLVSSGEITDSCTNTNSSATKVKVTKVSVLAILVGGVN
jgi:hypothetical protein